MVYIVQMAMTFSVEGCVLRPRDRGYRADLLATALVVFLCWRSSIAVRRTRAMRSFSGIKTQIQV